LTDEGRFWYNHAMKRLLLIAALVLQSVSVWSLPIGGNGFNTGKDEEGTTLEEWFGVESHWSAAALLPGTWADVQGSPQAKQTATAGNVFGVPASRALVERDAQGVIVAVIAEFDPTKQTGGASALAKRLTTSIGVYQGNTTWTTQFNDKVNVGKELTVTLHQQKNLVSVRLTRGHP
jgi:hypothetical protein